MKILKGAVLVCAIALLSGQAISQSTGDDWKLVAYNFARVNNYNIDDKDVTVTLNTREQRISGNSGCNRFMGRSDSRTRDVFRLGRLPEL